MALVLARLPWDRLSPLMASLSSYDIVHDMPAAMHPDEYQAGRAVAAAGKGD